MRIGVGAPYLMGGVEVSKNWFDMKQEGVPKFDQTQGNAHLTSNATLTVSENEIQAKPVGFIRKYLIITEFLKG